MQSKALGNSRKMRNVTNGFWRVHKSGSFDKFLENSFEFSEFFESGKTLHILRKSPYSRFWLHESRTNDNEESNL